MIKNDAEYFESVFNLLGIRANNIVVKPCHHRQRS